MKISLMAFLFLFLALTVVSCENDSEQDLIEVTIIPIATYENSVKTIIDNNCIICHNDPPINNAPMPLLTFDQVTDAVINDGLLNRVSTENNTLVMPPSGRLPQSTIDIILQWNTDGLLEQ